MRPVDPRLVAALADRYRIERELGAGGMATVYLAEDLKHHREVAIKVLRPDLAAALGADRFTQEIEIAARLQHPHILGVFDSGSADGFLYYVMPYVEGESLRERLTRQGELPVHEAVRLLVEIADALGHAHARGVVHRDIKPENVMLSGRHALVMDFGVAKAVNEASGRNRLTTVGVALGTPAYMAPEQASADPHLDHRVDIYALGVVGYELLAGRPPFVGGSPQQVLAAHVTQAPEPLSTHRPSLSPALAGVVMKALEKRPADRWQTAEEMVAQLEPLMTPSGGMTPTGTRPIEAVGRPRRWPKIATAAVVLGVGAGAVTWFLNRRPETAALTSNGQLTRLAGKEELPAIAPDGKSGVYLAFGPADSVPHVELRRTDGGDAVQIAGASRPVGWSPAGDRLLVAGPAGLESRPGLGGQGTLIDPRAHSAGWSPDGKQVAYVVGDSLFIGGVNHETPRLVTVGLQIHSPAWSPDGKWIAFVSGNLTYLANYNIAPSQIWLVPVAGGTSRPLTSADAVSMSPTWAPDSRRLLIVAGLGGVRDVYQLNLTSGGELRGPPVRISTGLNPSLISLSADGKQLAYSVATYYSNVWKIQLPRTGVASTRGALPVTNDRQVIEGLDISRDGRWLAFDSDREGVAQLFRMPLGGGPVQQITRDSNPAFKPSISPDGRDVVYHTIAQSLRRVFAIGIDGGAPKQLSPGVAPDERNGVWSPDGSSVAWQVIDRGNSGAQVARRDAAGRWGPPQTVPFNGRYLTLAWADQGTALIGIDSSWRAVVQPVAGGAARRQSAAVPLDPLFSGATRAPFPSVSAPVTTDGTLALFAFRGNDIGTRRAGILGLRLTDGASREVLRFDEPSRPHSFSSNGIAEHDGWLYFTLSDPQSDIWVATVKGFSK